MLNSLSHPQSHLGRVARFAVTGVANTAVDFAILNSLFLVYSQMSAAPLSEVAYMAFKGIAFAAAVLNSWYLNKNWVFADDSAPEKTTKDKAMFLVVSAFGFGVNVTVSMFAFVGFQSLGSLGEAASLNVGALFGTAAALVSNFIGYRLLVFKPTYEPTNLPLGDNPRV